MSLNESQAAQVLVQALAKLCVGMVHGEKPPEALVFLSEGHAAKIAKDRGIGGPVEAASAYLMKSPPKQLPDFEDRMRSRFDSHKLIEEFMIAANVAAAEALDRTAAPIR